MSVSHDHSGLSNFAVSVSSTITDNQNKNKDSGNSSSSGGSSGHINSSLHSQSSSGSTTSSGSTSSSGNSRGTTTTSSIGATSLRDVLSGYVSMGLVTIVPWQYIECDGARSSHYSSNNNNNRSRLSALLTQLLSLTPGDITTINNSSTGDNEILFLRRLCDQRPFNHVMLDSVPHLAEYTKHR